MPPPSMAQGTAFVTMARNTLSVYDVSCANIASMDPLRMRQNRSTPHRMSLSLKQRRSPTKYYPRLLPPAPTWTFNLLSALASLRAPLIRYLRTSCTALQSRA